MLACNGRYGLAFEMVQKKNEGTKIGGLWLKQQVNGHPQNTMRHNIVPSSKRELCMRFSKEWLKKRDKDNRIANLTEEFVLLPMNTRKTNVMNVVIGEVAKMCLDKAPWKCTYYNIVVGQNCSRSKTFTYLCFSEGHICWVINIFILEWDQRHC